MPPPNRTTTLTSAPPARSRTPFTQKLSSFFYAASLLLLIGLTGVCLVGSAYDIVVQALMEKSDSNTQDYRSLLVYGASYFLLIIISIIFTSSRAVTIRRALADIPKTYVPIHEDDITKSVHDHIQQELTRASIIAWEAQPVPEKSGQPGWGRPNSDMAGIRFKSAIANTPQLLERAIATSQPHLARPPNLPFSRYIKLLSSNRYNLFSLEIAEIYLDAYEKARFGDEEMSEEEYIEHLRVVGGMLKEIGYDGEERDDNEENYEDGEDTDDASHSRRTRNSSIAAGSESSLVNKSHRRSIASTITNSTGLKRNTFTSDSRKSISTSSRMSESFGKRSGRSIGGWSESQGSRRGNVSWGDDIFD